MYKNDILRAMKTIALRTDFVPCDKIILDLVQCACVCFRYNLTGQDVEIIRDACNCTEGFLDD